MIFAI